MTSRLDNDLRPDEEVLIKVKPMSSIPAGANPFNHDSGPMGTDLPRGWMIMHEGFDNKDNPLAMRWMYLCNTRTGQRIRLEFIPRVETPRDIVCGYSIDERVFESLLVKPLEDHRTQALSWYDVDLDRPHGSFMRLYVPVEDHFVRVPALLDFETYNVARKKEFLEPMEIEDYERLMVRFYGTILNHVERATKYHHVYEPLRAHGIDNTAITEFYNEHADKYEGI